MIRAAVALLSIALCFALPSLLPKWSALEAPRFKMFIIGALVAVALIATIISSSNSDASFVYVSF